MPPLRLAAARGAALALGLAVPTLAAAQGSAPAAPAAPAAQSAPSPASDKVVARVDGTPMTEGDLAVAADDPALSLPGVDEAQKRDLLVGYMIDLKLGAKAAEAAKVGE